MDCHLQLRILGIVSNFQRANINLIFANNLFEFNSVLSIGARVDDTTYIQGTRRKIVNLVLKYHVTFGLWLAGITLRKKVLSVDDVNYSYYLGPDYKNAPNNIGPKGRVPKYIAPHVSCFDPNSLIVAMEGDISFMAGAFMKKTPGLGNIASMIGCLFVPRAGTPEQKQKVIDILNQRTTLIE